MMNTAPLCLLLASMLVSVCIGSAAWKIQGAVPPRTLTAEAAIP